MATSTTQQSASLKARAGLGMLGVAYALTFFALYFLQLPTVGKSFVITLEVSLATLGTFLVVAFLSFKITFRSSTIASAVIVLLLIRHLFLANLVGTQIALTNILVGAILALSIVLLGSTLPSLGSKRSCLLLCIGFTCAPLIQIVHSYTRMLETGYLQEIVFALSALLILGYDLWCKPPALTPPSSDKTLAGRFRNMLVALGITRKTDALLISIVVLFFCLGLFEPFLFPRSNMPNLYTPFVLLSIALLALIMLLVSAKCSSKMQLIWSQRYVAACLTIVVVLSFMTILTSGMNMVLGSLVFVSMIVMHLVIWLRCCCALDHKINAITLTSCVFGCVMVFHRLGWCVQAATKQLSDNAPSICGAISLVAVVLGLGIICLCSLGNGGKRRNFWLSNTRSESGKDAASGATTGDSDSFSAKASIVFEECALTDRQREIALLYSRGRSITNIAQTLVLSENTVKTHIRNINQKCEVANRQDLIDKIEAS